MTLTDSERRILKNLADRKDAAVELETARQIAYWREMEARGYATLADRARCGLEVIRGTFVSITEAGRAAL